MAGTRRTRSSVGQNNNNNNNTVATPSTRILRAHSRAKGESDKENTPPKSTNAQVAESSSEKQQEICGICLDAVNADKGSLTVCVHTFCFDCIHQWSKTSNTCPMCKAKFRMINRTEEGKSKPKRVRVSDVDQRPDYSDPDPDDFLTDDEEDSGDDMIYFGASIFADFGDAWMDADDGEFDDELIEIDDEEDEDDDDLEAELIDEDELEDGEEEEEEDDDDENSWEAHIARANALRRHGEAEDSEYEEDDDCIIIEAPITRPRTRGAGRSTLSRVITIDIPDDDDDEGDYGDDEEDGLRRSRRLNTTRRLTTVIIDLDDDMSDNEYESSEPDEEDEELEEEEEQEEEEEEEEEEQEVHRTITTRSRSYPGANDSTSVPRTRSRGVTPPPPTRVTRSQMSRGATEITPSRVTRSQSRISPTINRPTRNRINNNNNNNDFVDLDSDVSPERRTKRARRTPTRFGFDSNTTTTTTTTTTSYQAEDDNNVEEENESRYNLRRRRSSDRMED